MLDLYAVSYECLSEGKRKSTISIAFFVTTTTQLGKDVVSHSTDEMVDDPELLYLVNLVYFDVCSRNARKLSPADNP